MPCIHKNGFIDRGVSQHAERFVERGSKSISTFFGSRNTLPGRLFGCGCLSMPEKEESDDEDDSFESGDEEELQWSWSYFDLYFSGFFQIV